MRLGGLSSFTGSGKPKGAFPRGYWFPATREKTLMAAPTSAAMRGKCLVIYVNNLEILVILQFYSVVELHVIASAVAVELDDGGAWECGLHVSPSPYRGEESGG